MNQAETVASYTRTIHLEIVAPTGYDGHMGAALTDGVLQAGVDWETTVRRRVERVAEYTTARTTSGFARLLEEEGAEALLNWHGRKLQTLRELIDVLQQRNIEIHDQFLTWLERPANRQRLQQIKGIKEKTADYLAQDVAVDRHLFDFVEEAGAPTKNYAEAHQIIREAAALLGIEPSTLDHSIWRYMSKRRKLRACKAQQN
jgi:hypothetical protein